MTRVVSQGELRPFPLHPAAGTGVDVEQSTTVVLQPTDGVAEISIRGADIAKYTEVRSISRKVIRSRSTSHAPVMPLAAARGIDSNATVVRRDVSDDRTELGREALRVRGPMNPTPPSGTARRHARGYLRSKARFANILRSFAAQALTFRQTGAQLPRRAKMLER